MSEDSCVEFFVQPAGSVGYFNFEVNAGGTLLVYFIEDPTRGRNGALFARFTELPLDLIEQIGIRNSLPRVVDPEITSWTHWTIDLTIPFSVLDRYAPGASERLDRPWRGNFHKCGDRTSHPHWASWSDIGEFLRFHQPEKFGQLVFDLR